jgi:hypothetical protein
VQSTDGRIMVNRAFLNLMGARYFVFDLDGPGMAPSEAQMILNDLGHNYPAVLTNQDFIIFRNDTARPYITAYARACLYAGDVRKSASLALALSTKDWPLVQAKEPSVSEVPSATAQKYEKTYGDDNSPFPPLNQGTLVALSDVQLSRENSQLIRIQLTAPSNCLAVIAESYYPFWRAEVDGQPVQVLQVSCGLMGLELPAGSHTIVLRYQPPRAYEVAAAVTLITLLAGAGVAFFSRRS